ncbi:MAG TPA: DUF4198 domain-containing protein [Myxococcales bacterium]|jgi:nickel transport protein
MSKRLLALATLMSLPSPAFAHDLWIERLDGQLVLQQGHRGEKLLPLDGTKVKALRCATGTEAPKDVLASATAAPTRVSVGGGCDAISAFLDRGFYSLTPDGEKNLPRSQVPDAVKAWQSRQFAKWIDPGSPAAARPLGDELEIVPVSDLSKAKKDDKATFRVLLGGKPVSGAVLAVDHKALGETDSAGEVRVKIRANQLECVSATLRRPLKSADADQLILEASLAFEVAK